MRFSGQLMLRQIGRHALCTTLVLALLGATGSQKTLDVTFNTQAQVSQPANSALEDLRKAFRSSYNEAIAYHDKNVLHTYPVITQDLLNMTLIRSNGQTERFTMDKKMYFLMANTSHPLLAIYSILSKDGFGVCSKQTIGELEDYLNKLSRAKDEVNTLAIEPKVMARILLVLTASIEYVQSVIQAGKTSLDDFGRYAAPLRRAIDENLYVGAKEQLIQFKEQVNKWRMQFPEEKWSQLRVVVLSFHQGRTDYALSLFFRWLLHEPNYEKRVVFAEFQSSISGVERQNAEKLALVLLTKVDFDLEASIRIFGDPRTLQVDVMGPASVKILKGWGKSGWPK